MVILLCLLFGISASVIFLVTTLFDQGLLLRKGTVYRGNEHEKKIAITFDDGPSPEWTVPILGELEKAKIKATFFMLGGHVEKYPTLAKRIVEQGHDIGNHTFTHHNLLFHSVKKLESEVERTAKIFREVVGIQPFYFRPPKGWLTGRQKRCLEEMGYTIILWSLNTKDWVGFKAKQIERYVLNKIAPGDIILFHDSGGVFKDEGGSRCETIQAVKNLVAALQQRGYEFVKITELLQQRKVCCES